MDVLIIGGSGFVSGAIARLAVAEGHDVWTLTRGQRPLPEGVKGLVADRGDNPAFAAAIRDAGATWDLAVDCIGYDPAHAEQDLAVLPGVAGHLVFISTDFVFDPAARTFPQRWDNPQFLRNGSYGAKKRRCEEMLLESDPRTMPWTVLRPCHIYGPGSQLGCLPEHGRDPQLVQRLREGTALRLVGGGYFLQQPIFVGDLARIVLACAGNPAVARRIFMTAGPDIVESRQYYAILATALDVTMNVEEVPVDVYLSEHPEHASFLCHRFCELNRLAEHGLPLPATPLEDGLRQHLESLLSD